MVKFDRTATKDLLTPSSQVEVTITREVACIAFKGINIIRARVSPRPIASVIHLWNLSKMSDYMIQPRN